MGKTGKWIRKFLTGKKVNTAAKEKPEKEITKATDQIHALTYSSDGGGHDPHRHRPTTPVSSTQPSTPREKRRWSFRRSSASPAGRQDQSGATDEQTQPGTNLRNHVATVAATDAALTAAKATAAVIQLTAGGEYGWGSAVEEAAAVRIQSVFRSYLARKALNALKGLVKLQALVRGHLVRKQATATLRCMQALVSVQSRALAQRLKISEQTKPIDQHRKSTHDHRHRTTSTHDSPEENIKIVEIDLSNYTKPPTPTKPRTSSYSNQSHRTPTKQETMAITDTSPRSFSNHFEEYSAQSSPKCYSSQSRIPTQIPIPRSEYAESLYSEYPFYPGYMANTESSRAKARSHSAPKQRPAEVLERQVSVKRRPSLEGRNVPRAVRMQRSSSHMGAAAQGYQYPWSVKLDRSGISLKESECGSTSTVANYCRSLVGFEVQGSRY